MNSSLQVLASATRTATNASAEMSNLSDGGLHLVIDVTAVPGTDTITVAIQGKDPVSGKWYTLLTSAAIVAVSTVVMKVFPNAPVVANLGANDFVPSSWRVNVTHSAATSFTYSIGANLV